MVSRLDHNWDTEAMTPSGIPSHIIFLAKTDARSCSSRSGPVKAMSPTRVARGQPWPGRTGMILPPPRRLPD